MSDKTNLGHYEHDAAAGGDRYGRSVAWTMLCLLLIGFAFVLDDWAAQYLELPARSAGREFALWVSELGKGWIIAVAGIAGSAWFFLRGRLAQARSVFLVAGTGLLTGLSATVLRVLLGRTRPHAQHAQGFYGVWHDAHWLIGKYAYNSFPSGHAATVFGLAAAVWLLDRRLGVPAMLYAFLVAWSRVAVSAHHLSDIVSAAVLGVFGAYWILKWCRPTIDALSQQLYDGWTRSRHRAPVPPRPCA